MKFVVQNWQTKPTNNNTQKKEGKKSGADPGGTAPFFRYIIHDYIRIVAYIIRDYICGGEYIIMDYIRRKPGGGAGNERKNDYK